MHVKTALKMDLTLAAYGSEGETARLFVGLCKSV